MSPTQTLDVIITQPEHGIPTPPDADIVGLAFDGTRLWASDRRGGKLYLYDAVHALWKELSGWHEGIPGPMTWDGRQLWVVVERSREIVAVDGTSGERITQVQIPKDAIHEVPTITGLAWDGRALWLCTGCGLCSSFYRINPGSGSVLQSFFPYCEPRGLVFVKPRLWTINYNGPHLAHRLSSRRVGLRPRTVVEDLNIFAATNLGKDTDPTALVYDGRDFWAADRISRKILKVDLGDLVYPRAGDGRRGLRLTPD